jgi:hypothetical protein
MRKKNDNLENILKYYNGKNLFLMYVTKIKDN